MTKRDDGNHRSVDRRTAGKRHRLLLVDDERQNLEFLHRALDSDYECVSFQDPLEALAAVQRGERFDLALVDQRMPDLTGIELLARLHELLPHMMRLILTAYTDVDDLIAAINRGEVYRYVLKPWLPAQIHSVLRQALERYEVERDRDRLIEELARATHQLQDVQTQLEERVRERTRELESVVTALRANQDFLDLAIRGANNGLWDWDLERDLLRFSSHWKAMLGYDDEEIGTTKDEWLGRVHPADYEVLQTALAGHLAGETESFLCEHRMLHKDGTYRWMLCRGMAVRHDNGQPFRLAGSQTDITGHGFHDRSTQLPVRTVLLDRLNHALLRKVRRSDYLFATLVLDLDNFHVIPQTAGHAAGDMVLCECGNRLKNTLRLVDTVAYLGRDEFGMLLDEISDISDVMRVGERIREVLKKPFGVGEQTLSLTASIGMAISATGYRDANHMLRDAENAARQAKNAGGDRCSLFDQKLSAQSTARIQMEVDLQQAIAREQLIIHFQPIISVARKKVVAVEALTRWRHPERGLIPPVVFIPLAEEIGLIGRIDEWVMRQACQEIAVLQKIQGVPPLQVSINVSGRRLHENRLIDEVSRLLAGTGLSAEQVCLEITETELIKDLDAGERVMTDLKQLGVQLALDDFGTGYSSLVYLNRFPVDSLKIDRGFVSKLEKDPHTQKIVRAIITLADHIGISTTGEGVETPQQLAMLTEMGCRNVQGYLYSPAISVADLRTFCTRDVSTHVEP